jgi:hypothetical protein
VSACGEARSGAVRKNRVKRASKKQEGSGLAEVAQQCLCSLSFA